MIKAKTGGAAARRARNRESMHTAILDAAQGIVSERGLDGLTIREVARRLGYSAASIYEYFESKEEILQWLYFQGANGLGVQGAASIASLPPGTRAVDGLRALARAYRAHSLANPELYRLVFGGMKDLPHPPHVDRMEDQEGSFGLLVELAKRGVAEGDFIDQPIPLISHACWSAVHGFVSLEIQGHICGTDAPGMTVDPEDSLRRRDEQFEALVRMVVRGIATESCRTRLDREDQRTETLVPTI